MDELNVEAGGLCDGSGTDGCVENVKGWEVVRKMDDGRVLSCFVCGVVREKEGRWSEVMTKMDDGRLVGG